jgi:hypothetical protein
VQKNSRKIFVDLQYSFKSELSKMSAVALLAVFKGSIKTHSAATAAF